MPRLTTKRSLVPKINRKAPIIKGMGVDNSHIFSSDINKWIKGRRLDRAEYQKLYREL